MIEQKFAVWSAVIGLVVLILSLACTDRGWMASLAFGLTAFALAELFLHSEIIYRWLEARQQ